MFLQTFYNSFLKKTRIFEIGSYAIYSVNIIMKNNLVSGTKTFKELINFSVHLCDCYGFLYDSRI